MARQINAVADPLFGTHKTDIQGIWDQMQRLQTDFTIAQELSFYYTSTRWHEARTVLDIGTGNGYYLNRIVDRFPNKHYTGIDSSAELIDIANRTACRSNVSFQEGCLFDHNGAYDFVLMRLLLQHLDDIPAALDHIAHLTRPGGTALIIDANDSVRFFYPKLPQFTEFFAAYTEHERRAGRDRRVADRITDAISTSTAWSHGDTLSLLIPSTIDRNLELFTQTYTLLVDLVSAAGELEYDFESVKSAWRRWSALPNAYTQVGLNLIRIDRA
ncbi:class I SAM-dependent methyltransferase [Mycobacterium sp. OTB74]|uniref:class I SAM-dependent methyltransferase n=1 Tax=Mycobacterium sp. OTB74 TaxID=1853452 RepID=UPI0024751D4F|nr:class I SAM-dependent methyltransferase [Mycobacterium sp. OTB74]